MGLGSGKSAGFALMMVLPFLVSAPALGKESARVGDLSVSVEGVERHREISFDDVLYRPDEDFLVIRLAIRNEGGRVKVLQAPELLDAGGTTYRASWKGWVLPFNFSRYEALVPGAGRPFSVLFDVPAEGAYKLVVRDGDESVELPVAPAVGDVMAQVP